MGMGKGLSFVMEGVEYTHSATEHVMAGAIFGQAIAGITSAERASSGSSSLQIEL